MELTQSVFSVVIFRKCHSRLCPAGAKAGIHSFVPWIPDNSLREFPE